MESQSRYSIVERLVQKKIEILTAKGKLNDEQKLLAQKVDEMQKDYTGWQQTYKNEQLQHEREMRRNIERAINNRDNAKANMKDKSAMFDEELKVIDAALKSIERISGDAPTPQEQARSS